MDIKEIKNILDLIAESDVNQVTIEEGEFKIKVKKTADVIAGSSAPVQYQMPASPQQSQSPASPATPQTQSGNSGEQDDSTGAEEVGGQVIESPIVGTFYCSPSPDDDPFVSVGDQIKEGETLCIVEAMKIMNEIDSEISGTVKKILVNDGDAVEFEQPLFVVE